jgi:hypothetical protein
VLVIPGIVYILFYFFCLKILFFSGKQLVDDLKLLKNSNENILIGNASEGILLPKMKCATKIIKVDEVKVGHC